MFHKLLDVFVSALIFILGIALVYVLLNYALSKVSYSVIIPTGYPLNQEYQKELFHRDYDALYMSSKEPYQDAEGFRISDASDWVYKTSYFGISNPKSNEKADGIFLQGYPTQYIEMVDTPVFGSQDYNQNPGAPFTRYHRDRVYQYAEYYPMFADPDTSGYFMALFNPTLAPYKRDYTSDLSYKLYLNNLVSKYTTFGEDGKEEFDKMMLILGGLKYIYAPIPIIGYTPSEIIYSPSFYIMSGEYNNKQVTLKVVSMERTERVGGYERKLTLYIWYDRTEQQWKPLVMGAPDFEDTVMVLPTTFNTYYSVSVLVQPVMLEYSILPKIIIDTEYTKKLRNKYMGTFDVIGNPVYSVDDEGNLALISNNTIYEIQVYSYAHTGSGSIKYLTELKENRYYTDYSEWFDKLNKLNVH